MSSQKRPFRRTVCGLIAALLISALAWLPAHDTLAQAASIGQLQQQINAGQGRVSGLSGAVAADSSRLGQLNAGIATLERRIAGIQARLEPELAQLARLRSELWSARNQLSQLESLEARGEAVLARQLVGTYEGGQPDLVTAVLEAHGFQDLLDQISFVKRIGQEDAQVVASVRAARRAVALQATRLGALEARQQTLTGQVLAQRNQLLSSRVSLVNQQITVARARSASAGQLATARAQVGSLQAQLSKIEAAQAAAAAARSAASTQAASSGGTGTGSSGAGQVVSSGGLTFPLPKGAASPPGSWSPDDGVDISAPGGTPEFAVCSGTIVLHGIGGFGQWAPVIHCDSPVDGYSYVYYGHAGPANELPIGTHVGAGQVIAEVGPGIVGISTGPHLELGFCDSSGAPLGPQTSGTMMSLLQSAYGG